MESSHEASYQERGIGERISKLQQCIWLGLQGLGHSKRRAERNRLRRGNGKGVDDVAPKNASIWVLNAAASPTSNAKKKGIVVRHAKRSTFSSSVKLFNALASASKYVPFDVFAKSLGQPA
jgi:hypothetical protein